MTVRVQNLETFPWSQEHVVQSLCPPPSQRSYGLWGVPYLPAHGSDLSLVHAGLRHNIREGASCQVLHHHPELFSYKVTGEPKADFKIRMHKVLKLSYKCNKNTSCI